IIANAQASLFTPQGQQVQNRTVTKTVFTNVHVLKVGAATGQLTTGGQPAASQTGGVASSLTLVMTQCDWEFLRWLQANSTLTYTLGSYQDYKPQDTAVVVIDVILADQEGISLAGERGVGRPELGVVVSPVAVGAELRRSGPPAGARANLLRPREGEELDVAVHGAVQGDGPAKT